VFRNESHVWLHSNETLQHLLNRIVRIINELLHFGQKKHWKKFLRAKTSTPQLTFTTVEVVVNTMANCCGGGVVDKEAQRQNKLISKQLHDERKGLENELKLLLLGAGESGKSTIAKQMKIIHMKGFTKEEKMSYKSLIYANTFSAIKTLCKATQDLGVEITEPELRELARTIVDDPNYFNGDITQKIADDITALWKNKAIQTVYQRRSEFQLNDSAQYYIEAVQRLAKPDYVPDEQDVLRSRVTTTGIIETVFEVDKARFRLVDVGGQRSERKKWMTCFTDVAAVLFCVALSEYDLKLFEDNQTRRMDESLKLFREIVNSKWFVDTCIILFLNKCDLYKEKIKKVPITVQFPEYQGDPHDYNKTIEYIRDKFVALNTNPKKQIYYHVTCATDTNNVRIVFDAVRDTVLHKALRDSGLAV
jgi:guanine nucleotide-binding protein G(i) subunit alpha